MYVEDTWLIKEMHVINAENVERIKLCVGSLEPRCMYPLWYGNTFSLRTKLIARPRLLVQQVN
jgi:hypothetical protein